MISALIKLMSSPKFQAIWILVMAHHIFVGIVMWINWNDVVDDLSIKDSALPMKRLLAFLIITFPISGPLCFPIVCVYILFQFTGIMIIAIKEIAKSTWKIIIDILRLALKGK